MQNVLIETIKTTNTIVCLVNNKIKWVKCRHTGRFTSHALAKVEMEEQKDVYAKTSIDVNAKLNLSIVFIALFVAVMLIMNVETIDVVLSTLSVIGFLSIAIVVTNKKDVVLFQ